MRAVLNAGQQVFGENRVQEAAERWPAFLETFPGVQLHLIGTLQTNKAPQALDMFQAIHSVDGPKLAKILAWLASEMGPCPGLFIQVNTGAEPQKAGVLPDVADALVALCLDLGLPVAGQMCIPPADAEPVPQFRYTGRRTVVPRKSRQRR